MSAPELSAKIMTQADSTTNPRESLVQWYYMVDDLHARVKSLSGSHAQLSRLAEVKNNLRAEIDNRKKAFSQTKVQEFYKNYTGHLSGTVPLSTMCKNQYEIVDDWSYALDLPTPLVLATWDIESSCGWYKPSNGDGVFQLVSKEYGSSSQMTKGEWIMMMYDYAQLLKDKMSRYHTANKLNVSSCSSKSTTATGQTAPICLNYTSMDLDSIIKYGALYNGLSGGKIKGDIQPAAADYVYGKFGSGNQSAKKDGLLMRILKISDYVVKK